MVDSNVPSVSGVLAVREVRACDVRGLLCEMLEVILEFPGMVFCEWSFSLGVKS